MAAATLPEEEVIDVDADLPKGFELIGGKLVGMPDMGAEASWVATRLLTLLDRHCSEKKFGVPVSAEFSYQCFAKSPGLVRKPDVSVLLTERETYVPPKIHSKVAPGLAVEVLSPGNRFTDMIEKYRGVSGGRYSPCLGRGT
jgi:Uma2 family endonuclease